MNIQLAESPRQITVASVRAVRRTERISIAAPGDFALSVAAPLDAAGAAREVLLPYCLDILRRRSLYVGGVDAKAAQDAPFYYLHLRREARTVVSVPWEAAPLVPGAARLPIFLFSPGRCGSTLLSRIFAAAGLPNVSEPDFYTQLTSPWCASAFNPLRARVQAAVAAMGSDLCAALGPDGPPVVKLRAESCRAPQLLLQPGERRTLFLTRGFEAWARSNLMAFRNAPRKSVGKYLGAMRCHAWLLQHSACHVLRYEDLLSSPLDAAAALAKFLGRPIAADAVLGTMNEDSQQGTPLRQGARAAPQGWERRLDDTMALWNSAKVRQLRERLGVDA